MFPFFLFLPVTGALKHNETQQLKEHVDVEKVISKEQYIPALQASNISGQLDGLVTDLDAKDHMN